MQRGIDYIGVGVGAMIVNEKGQLFLSKRGPLAKNERGCWEFPGGSVEFGETLRHALQREILEEYGIDIQVDTLLDVVDHILPNEGQHWVSPTYLCRLRSGNPKILEPGKCSDIGWFSIDEIPAPLSMISAINLENYLQKIFPRTP